MFSDYSIPSGMDILCPSFIFFIAVEYYCISNSLFYFLFCPHIFLKESEAGILPGQTAFR